MRNLMTIPYFGSETFDFSKLNIQNKFTKKKSFVIYERKECVKTYSTLARLLIEYNS